VFAEREPVIVTRNQSDEHHWFGAVFQESVKCFERFFAIAGEQMIAELEVRQFA